MIPIYLYIFKEGDCKKVKCENLIFVSLSFFLKEISNFSAVRIYDLFN